MKIKRVQVSTTLKPENKERPVWTDEKREQYRLANRMQRLGDAE